MQVVTWLPQNDVLAHARTRAFLSHVGINSMYEVIPLMISAPYRAPVFRNVFQRVWNIIRGNAAAALYIVHLEGRSVFVGFRDRSLLLLCCYPL